MKTVIEGAANKIKSLSLTAILGTLGTVITLIGSIVGGFLFLDNRFAHADAFAQYKVVTQSVQKQTDNIQQMLLMQMQTRETILEMKQAQQKLTPEETVELNNLKQILKQIQNPKDK